MPELLETTVDKFVFRVPTDRLYSEDGVWVLPEDGDRVRVGLTDFVQQRNGDVAFADVQPVGTVLEAGAELATIETMKVVLGLRAPLAGTIVAVNAELETAPEAINRDPYGAGWLAVLAARDLATARAALLEPAAYFARMRSEAEEAVREP